MATASLCSVCVEAKPKYTCPVCSTRTCSLICSKRHKLRSSCEGQQRPSAFKAKSELHPSQVAADFNFLTSVQRSLDRAAIVDFNQPRSRPDARTRDICKSRGVAVLPAPCQSSRASRNMTSCGSNGNIVWTVEWIIDNNAVTTTETDEHLPIGDTFERQVLPSLLTRASLQTPTFHLQAVNPEDQTISLSPLAGTDSLSNALANTTILEFPTIHVSVTDNI